MGKRFSPYNKNGVKKNLKKDCSWLWTRVVINSNGSVSPCCAYFPEKYDFRNAFKDRFKDVWNSRKDRVARLIVREYPIRKSMMMKLYVAFVRYDKIV
jgi:radical SAM protein with 4Fe4S-binding SPASM domain